MTPYANLVYIYVGLSTPLDIVMYGYTRRRVELSSRHLVVQFHVGLSIPLDIVMDGYIRRSVELVPILSLIHFHLPPHTSND